MKSKLLSSLMLCSVILFSGSSNAGLVSLTNNTFGSVDDNFDFRNFNVSGLSGFIDEVTISITFSKCGEGVNETGCINGSGIPYFDEIGFALIAPTGEVVSLVENNSGNELFETAAVETFALGSSNGSLITILFSDLGLALPNIPVSGTFAPVGTLSSFNGLAANGLWQLFYEDNVGLDPLGFHSSTLTISTVSAPTTLSLFGLALFCLVYRKRYIKSCSGVIATR